VKKHDAFEEAKSEKELFFDDGDEKRAIFGIEDRFLKAVRSTFGVGLVARNNSVRLSGDEASVVRAERALLELRRLYAQGIAVTMREVEAIAEAIANESGFDDKGQRIEIFAQQV
jgi:phosphate starvation-inducible protein PhoH